MNYNPLIPIGSKIKIEKSKIENVIPNKLLDGLPQIINGKVVDYKMTDGMGIGYVLMTENNLKIWIFNSELNDQTRKEYKIEDLKKSENFIAQAISSKLYKVKYDLNGNRKLKNIANPINLLSWLIFTLKDIF